MPNVLPTIPNDPPQGIQALLDKVYLWNPDVSNELIEKINALLAKLGDAIGAILPYSELVAPISQYEPCYYGSGVYVAARELDKIPMEFNEADWILIATKGVTAEEAAQTYLPLTGGEMTGLLTLNATEKPQHFFQSAPLLQIKAETEDGSTKLDKTITITPNGVINFGNSYIKCDGLFTFSSRSDIGTPLAKWLTLYVTQLNNGADLTVPTEGGTLARVEDINTIGGVGTAGQVLTKTEVGMAWQDAAGGSSLPDQAGNAGKFLTTNGTEASWGDALVNKSAYPDNNIILLGNAPKYGDDQNSRHVIIGADATVYDSASLAVSIGWNACADSYSVAVGAEAKAKTRAMQFGSGTNNDANTVKFANANGNFEIMDANGNVPLERLTYVTNQIGDISTALTAILGE